MANHPDNQNNTDNTLNASGPSPELSRDLSLFHITMMGLGMMIGAGVFLGMGISINKAGPGGVVLTFALNGLLALLTAMSFAELSSAIPRAGGAYNFARIGFGRGTSFIAGWMEWFASSVAGAMYAITFAIYTIRFFDTLGWLGWLYRAFGCQAGTPEADNILWWIVKCVAVATAALFIYINFRGASETGKIGAIITMGQTIFVVTIGCIGIYVSIKDPQRLQNFSPFMPNGWLQLLSTMGFTYVAFEGYEVIAQAGDEAIEPRKNLPKAMLYSVMIVTIIYVLVAFATVVSVKAGSEGVEGAPWKWIGSFEEKGFGEAVARLMPFGNFVLTLAVIFSSTSALNATIYSATRASYALGRDKMLPGWFAKIHPSKKTPYGALTVTGVVVLIVATMLPTKDVASSASIMFLFLFFLVNFCVIKIRRSMSDELTYGFMMPLFPLFPILAIICQVVLAVWLVHMSYIAWIVAPVWVISGLMIYLFYSKSRAVVTEDEILVLEEQPAVQTSDDKPLVMVAVANPDNALELVQKTYQLANAKSARVELLHMVQVPDQVSLTDAEHYMMPGKEAITEAMLYLSMHFPISSTIRYCRNVARGIVSAIRERKADTLVLGWHGKPSKSLFNIGSTIDPIVEQAHCNVIVLKDCAKNKKFENILVPVAGGPHSSMAIQTAKIFSEEDSKITIMTVKRDGGEFDLDGFIKGQCEKLNIDESQFLSKIVKSNSAVRAICKEADNYDLVVMGTTNSPVLAQIGHASIPEKIACRCGKPTIIVKSNAGVRSWINRWI